MHRSLWLFALACAVARAGAQQPDAVASRPVADSVATNARRTPNVSAVVDLLADLSPQGSTQSDGTRIGVRQLEVALQAALDAHVSGDVFVELRGHRVSITEAYLAATALPLGMHARLGRFLMPVGALNTTHRHDLHTVEYPYVVQKMMSDAGLGGTGLAVSRVFAPFGFTQELIVAWVDRFGDPVDSLKAPEQVNRYVDGMGYSARLRNAWAVSRAVSMELGASAMTGDRPTSTGFTDAAGRNAVNARQTLAGTDFTWRWTAPEPARHRSLLVQAEWMWQLNDKGWLVNPGAAGAPVIRDYDGGYVYARWQLGRRVFAGGRWDSVRDPAAPAARLTAGSTVLEWYPSEFSKFLATWERRRTAARAGEDRILLQASFAIGSHRWPSPPPD